jgi:hypothetical protein
MFRLCMAAAHIMGVKKERLLALIKLLAPEAV